MESDETNREKNLIKDNSKDGSLFSSSFFDLISDKEKERATHKETFRTSRMIPKESTHPVETQGFIFKLFTEKTDEVNKLRAKLSPEELKTNKEANLIPTIGLHEGVLASKVMIGLSQTLAEQSEIYGTEEDMLGISKELEKRGKPILQQTYNGVVTQFPYILIREYEFTQLVKGKKKIGGSDVLEVRNMVERLSNVYLLAEYGDRYSGDKLFTIENPEWFKNGKDNSYMIALRTVFVNAIKKNFVTMRKDTLQILSGNTSDLTMRMFLLLIEQHSYKGTPIYPIYMVNKETLLNRIAIRSSYKKNKTRLKKDFDNAIEKMKELKIITNYKEEKGKDGWSIHSIFTLNKNYTKDDHSLESSDKKEVK